MVTSDWLYPRWLCCNIENKLRFRVFLTQRRLAVKLELGSHSGLQIDVFHARNPTVASDWLYLRWFSRYGQNRVRF